MVLKNHYCFQDPDNLEVKVWRYLDFTKFISLLESKCLYFCRADKFEDPLEGLRPAINKDTNSPNYEGIHHRKHLAVLCWHMNEVESAAMWKLYLNSNEGVAIQTTYSNLKAIFQSKRTMFYMGRVNYIDYKKEEIPSHNSYFPITYKKKVF